MTLSEKYQQLRKEGIPDLHNIELLKECQKDNDLLDELLRENKEFIFHIISQYKGNVDIIKDNFNVTEEELLQHGYIGMISALKDFDFDKGIKFTTYAYRPIIWEINQLLYNDAYLVRLSRGAIDILNKIRKAESSLDYSPTPEELSEMINVPVERIEEVLRFSTGLSYLGSTKYEPVDNSSTYEIDVTDRVYVENLIEDAGLDDFESKVADLIMHGLNNSQIAEKLDVYPMTINRAIDRIRSKIENDFEDKRVSKYEDEIKLISEEIMETGEVLHIDDMKDLLEVCGYNVSEYTPRILYYIRQKAVNRVTSNK